MAVATSIIAATIGAAGVAYAANKQASAAKDAANAQMKLAKPGVAGQAYAIGALTNYSEQVLKPGLGVKSGYMESAHRANLSDIDEAKAAGDKSIKSFWQRAGNLGRSRGELLLNEFRAEKERRDENNEYGLATENYLEAKRGQYLNTLSTIGQLGGQGMSIAGNAIQTKAEADAARYGDLGAMAGSIAAWGLSKYAEKQPTESDNAKKTKAAMAYLGW